MKEFTASHAISSVAFEGLSVMDDIYPQHERTAILLLLGAKKSMEKEGPLACTNISLCIFTYHVLAFTSWYTKPQVF